MHIHIHLHTLISDVIPKRISNNVRIKEAKKYVRIEMEKALNGF